MSGFALFHRSLIGHPAFRNDSEAMAFAYMTLRASWKATRVRYKGKAIELDRGQLAMSVRDLAEAMDRDKGWVERLLKRLKSETMIETRTETGVMVITVCNYEKYQCSAEVGETPSKTAGETQARQTQDTEQRPKQLKEEKKTAPKRARTEQFEVPDWVPAEQWAAFSAMRDRKKVPIDSYIASRLFTKLEAMASAGWDIAKVLDKATINLWTDLYTPTPGRDDDMRANTSAKPGSSAPVDQAAYLAKLADKPWASASTAASALPARRGNTGPPRPIGDLIQMARR